MARIRSIKPEFWSSEQVMECSPMARLLFVGLWNFCDDAGRHPFSPRQIKALVFPADDFSSENILGMLDELSSNGLIDIYVVENRKYLQVTGWRHQKIDRPQPPRFPGPIVDGSSNDIRHGGDDIEEQVIPVDEHSPNDQRMVSTEHRGEGKGSRKDKIPNLPASSPTTPIEPAALALADFRKSIVDAFRRGNSPNIPDTSRAQTWMAQGYDPAICVAVITELIAKKPSISRLSYFDGAIKDAHQNRAASAAGVPKEMPKDEPMIEFTGRGGRYKLPLRTFQQVIERYKKTSDWVTAVCGPGPDSWQCSVPVKILAEYGIDTPPPVPEYVLKRERDEAAAEAEEEREREESFERWKSERAAAEPAA